jgi:hypothetical protein
MSQPLLKRLTSQLAAKGVQNAKGVATGLLEKRGHLKNGKLTAEGHKRDALGAAGRAKDRAVKRSGGSPDDYSYNPKTNATRKRR